MIYISQKKADIVAYLKANPGKKYGEVREALGFTHGEFSFLLSGLEKVGVIRKEGVERKYSYFYTGQPYNIGLKPREEYDFDRGPDELLDHLPTFRLTEEQKRLLNENRHLPRRQIAKLLGVSKIELNYVLDKEKPEGSHGR